MSDLNAAEPMAETVIQKLPNTDEYKDYYKQRTELEAKREEIETKFQAARRTRDRDQIRILNASNARTPVRWQNWK